MKDIFHVMNKMYLPVNHGLYFEFYLQFRSAIFTFNADDMKNVRAVLRKREGIDIDKFLRKNMRWLMKRVRRAVRPKEELYQRMKSLFEMYQDRLDASSGKPLFNALAKKEAKGLLIHVRNGCINDVHNLISVIITLLLVFLDS